MNKIILIVILNFLFTRQGVTSTQNETATESPDVEEIPEEGECTGPGSDPYNNLAFNGACNCKRNVRGKYCSECRRGSFDLKASHRTGCLNCFCSGLSSACGSSDWVANKVQLSFEKNTQGIELLYRSTAPVGILPEVDQERGLVTVKDLPLDYNDTYYWMLPDSFLGNRLTSYGGYLNFSIEYETKPPVEKTSKKWLNTPLAIIVGNNSSVFYRFRKRHRRVKSYSLAVAERTWNMAATGPQDGNEQTPTRSKGKKKKNRKEKKSKKKEGKKRRRQFSKAKRKELMAVLADVHFILIKANYRPYATIVSLLTTSMSTAFPTAKTSLASTQIATSVEKCDCPVEYGGLSCSYCASGYTRRREAGDEGGAPCVPCHCNGHSQTCDQLTGKCFDCGDKTGGDHCEFSLLQCDRRGTLKHQLLPGFPPKCICKSRVKGELCDMCKPGYFLLEGDEQKGCSRNCWCSGVTSRCAPSQLKRFPIQILPPASIVVGYHDIRRRYYKKQMFNHGRATYKFRNHDYQNLHWLLPKEFTGNILKSYGGNLTFWLYSAGHCKHAFDRRASVELQRNSGHGDVVKWKFRPRLDPNSPKFFSIRMVEEDFAFLNHRSDRNTFLGILSSLKSIIIHVPFCRGMRSTEIRAVKMDTAGTWATEGSPASEVEECRCPPGYEGLSCEDCSLGYIKDLSGRRCITETNYS